MLETQNLPVVSIVNGQPTTLSTDISNFFEKPHNDVLKPSEQSSQNCQKTV